MHASTPPAPSPSEELGAGASSGLPKPPGVLRRWIDRHPRTIDVLLACVTVVVPFSLAFLTLAAVPAGRALASLVWAALAGAALIVGTMLRRRRPFLLLAVSLLVSAALPFIPGEIAGAAGAIAGVSTWVALYSLAIFAAAGRAWIGFACSVAVSFAMLQVDSEGPPRWEVLLANLVQVGAVFLIPTLVGLWIGGRRRYELALIARAEDLARERDQRARLAVSEERTRIAREMHDIVSHSLTVVITLSEGAAAQAERGSDRASDAMRRVAETGRASLAEMRRLLGVLRDPDASPELAPLPGSDDLGSLVSQFREAGMPVTWRHEGGALPGGGISLTVFRVVQEALTNVLRHAPGSPSVTCTTRVSGTRVDVVVDNDMTSDPAPSTDGSGRGIIGMRERAALHGGTAEAWPTPAGTWRVLVTLFDDPPEGDPA